MAKTVIHELVERIVVEDRSGSALSGLAKNLADVQGRSTSAHKSISALCAGLQGLGRGAGVAASTMETELLSTRRRNEAQETYGRLLREQERLLIAGSAEGRQFAASWELQSWAIDQAGQSLSTLGNTAADVIGGLMVGEVANARDVIRSLVRSIGTQLVGALIRFGVQQMVANALQQVEIAQNNVVMSQLVLMIGLYSGVAVAAKSAKVATLGPLGLVMHSGGYIPLHSGGSIPRAHGGLRADEVGPFVLQRGEFVLQRSAVQAIGAANVAAMNRTGRVPGNSTFNIVINARAGADGKRIGRELMNELSWASRTGKLQLDKRSIVE